LQLDLKTVGWGPAARPTNRRTELVADWIEAQALISGQGSAVSKHEIVDRLEGTALVADSDDGWALVEDAFWACRSRRKQISEAYPFGIAGDSIELVDAERLAYLFCLLVSLPEQLQSLRTRYPTDFRDIFEQLVVEALKLSLPGWQIYSTGWSAIAADEGKGAIVGRVGEWTLAKQWDATVFPNANDAQVDIAAVRPFGDARSAFPVLLGQCATGVTDWKTKASRPNLDRWNMAVQFTSKPTKLFAVPFSLDDHSFWEATSECRGLVLDRARICMALPRLSAPLSTSIEDWLGRARQALPLAA
jgi:hypothetical protein